MPGNSFGQALRITTAGESHGPANIVIIDGCPPGLPLSPADLLPDLRRRRPGQSKLVTQRQEPDDPEILSGVYEGKTTGTTIAVLIRNEDQRSKDYSSIENLYRPGHADLAFDQKYGLRDPRGGGRSSARESVARVAAGAVARKLLRTALGVEVLAWVCQVGPVQASLPDLATLTLNDIETFPDGQPNPVRCPDQPAALAMIQTIEQIRREQDSIGGAAMILARGVPPGLGEPVFDKLKADLAKALFSLPAVLGVEYGIGFGCCNLRGSQNNDQFLPAPSLREVRTATNRHGGMLGGISTGMPIVLRVAVKPTSSIPAEQPTVDQQARPATIRTLGRHDPCLLPRFIPMAEAMVCLALADHWLRWRAQAALVPDQQDA